MRYAFNSGGSVVVGGNTDRNWSDCIGCVISKLVYSLRILQGMVITSV